MIVLCVDIDNARPEQVQHLLQVLEDSGDKSAVVASTKQACLNEIQKMERDALGPLTTEEIEQMFNVLLNFVLYKQPEDLYHYAGLKREHHEGGWFVNRRWNFDDRYAWTLIAQHADEQFFQRYLNTPPFEFHQRLQRLKRRMDVCRIKRGEPLE